MRWLWIVVLIVAMMLVGCAMKTEKVGDKTLPEDAGNTAEPAPADSGLQIDTSEIDSDMDLSGSDDIASDLDGIDW
jgi:hypothetical protein